MSVKKMLKLFAEVHDVIPPLPNLDRLFTSAPSCTVSLNYACLRLAILAWESAGALEIFTWEGEVWGGCSVGLWCHRWHRVYPLKLLFALGELICNSRRTPDHTWWLATLCMHCWNYFWMVAQKIHGRLHFEHFQEWMAFGTWIRWSSAWYSVFPG